MISSKPINQEKKQVLQSYYFFQKFQPLHLQFLVKSNKRRLESLLYTKLNLL